MMTSNQVGGTGKGGVVPRNAEPQIRFINASQLADLLHHSNVIPTTSCDVTSGLDLPVLSPLHLNEISLSPYSELMQILEVEEPMEEGQENLSIVDVSPEWTFTNGGSKVLLIGSWTHKDAIYTCQFGETKVSATWIQAGVLRCIAPAHSAGIVPLRVFHENAISNEYSFEFKDTDVLIPPLLPSISVTPSRSRPSSLQRSTDTISDFLSPEFNRPRSEEVTAFSSPVVSPVSSRSTLSILEDPVEDGDGVDSPSVVDWCEFLGDSRNVIENDFSNLSLSAREQHELYEAASKIQTAFRKYVERREKREKAAAVRIQNYYRKYRRKRMDRAATVIQSQFRTYRQHRKLKQSHEAAATVIQKSFRHYAQNKEDSFRC